MNLEKRFTDRGSDLKEIEEMEGEYPESLGVQSKIIKTLNTGNEYGDEIPIVSEDNRQEFLRRLAYAEIPKPAISKILGGRVDKGRLDEEKSVVPALMIKDALQANASLRIFLNILLSRPVGNSVSVTKVLDILDTYPTPDLFEQLVEKVAVMLDGQKAIDARKYGRKLAVLFYGDKEEIWEQLKLLKQEAEFIFGKTIEKTGIIIKELRGIEIAEALSRVEIHGDPWQGRFLKAKDLEAEGLAPKLKIEINGKNIWFSSAPYLLYEGRLAVVGYVEDKEKLVARTFYRSNSHGIWKYLPKYLERDGKIAWFHKGHGEESISLPALFQQALAHIVKENPVPIYVDDPDFIFAGTARQTSSRHGDDVNNTFQAEIEEQGNILDGNFYTKNFDKKVSPEKIDFINLGQLPDFSKVIYKWKQDTTHYGVIDIEVFISKDKKIQYMFCNDKLGRVWIGGIEINSPIGSTGLRQKWVNGGDLTTPAYEYYDQTGGYGNYDLSAGDHYVDMFKNYLSKVPLIKRYIESKKQR